MKSNKKILTSVDLSRNDIYNVSQIVGSEYSTSPMGQDLIVQSLGSGKVVINSTTGKVQLLSGSTSWSNGTVTDNTAKRNNLSSGVEVTGTGVTIANGSTSGSVVMDAPNVSLRASSTADAEKTSVKLSSTNDSVAIKGSVISEIATTSETINAPTIAVGSTNTTDLKITASTSLGLDIVAKQSTTYTNANGVSRTCNSLVKTNNANVNTLDVTTVDVAGDISVTHGNNYDTSATYKTGSFRVDSTQIEIDRHADTTADHKLKIYAGTTTSSNYQYNNKNSKPAKNSKGYLIIDDITSNVELDAQTVDVHDNFDINVPAGKHVEVRTPSKNEYDGSLTINAGGTYTFSENHGSTVVNPTLQISASTSNSSIAVKDLTVNDHQIINGSSHTTQGNPALKVVGAATVTGNAYLNGNINFDSATGKILNTNASKTVEIETDNIKLSGVNTTITGTTASILTTNTIIGSTTKEVSITGKNNLTINSNQSTSASYVRATNIKADNSLQVNNFNIYYDSATSSLVFAQGV